MIIESANRYLEEEDNNSIQFQKGEYIEFKSSGRIVDEVWGSQGISGYNVNVDGDVIFINASDVIGKLN